MNVIFFFWDATVVCEQRDVVAPSTHRAERTHGSTRCVASASLTPLFAKICCTTTRLIGILVFCFWLEEVVNGRLVPTFFQHLFVARMT